MVADIIETALGAAADFVWGPVMLVLLLGTGLFFTIRTRFIQAARFGVMWKRTFGDILKGRATSSGGITPFQAMCAALASTMGTGNVVGVAAALTAGGPGAIFWMWISAFLGMATKFAEVVLCQKYRLDDGHGGFYGGPMYVIRDRLHMPRLAALFALLALPAAVGMGNMIQSGAIAQAAGELLSLPPATTGLVSMALVAVVVVGGMGAIVRVTETLVPVMASLYIAGCLLVILLCHTRILSSFAQIIGGAFTLRCALSGTGGYLMAQAVRIGLARGAFSNEAGLGSAAIAHAAAGAHEPVEQGFWGAIEVFLDTIVTCTLTALVILTSGVFDSWLNLKETGLFTGYMYAGNGLITPVAGNGDAPLAILAFSRVLGDAGGFIVGVSTILFALASILGWCFYGEKCCDFLFPNHKALVRPIYRIVYIALVFFGATAKLGALWILSDVFNGLMAIPNIIALFLLSGVVVKETRSYWARAPYLK